uniref:Uncharacterized protein n=1 Tax=Anas platyrhynchos platyrhynchos TaxID=8840 RepID=U3IJR4_ANAPP
VTCRRRWSFLCLWPRNTKCLIQDGLNSAPASPAESLAHGDVTVPSASLQTLSHVKYKDFIRCLPVYLSQYILGLLDQKSLKACAAVSGYWAFLVKEVEREHVCQGLVQDKIRYLQGLRPRGAVSNYAKIVNVTIPQSDEEGHVIEVKRHSHEGKTKEEGSLQAAYHDLQTDTIQLEERNVFCGSYNIRVLTDRSDQNRVIHYSGGDLVAIGSTDQKVSFFDISEMREVPPLLSGHAGSIKALLLDEKKGFVFSASFDLSIRCWDIFSGACVKIFNGHCGTISCLDVHERRLVSEARDGMVKVWNLDSGVCLKTLQHNDVVCVKMDGVHVVSGCDRGLVKVWLAETGALVKILEGHQGPVKCLSFDQWHLVTGSSDGYALGWSMVGDLKRCLTAFRHPKEVLSLEFLYLRVVSGCADGKIRVFNYLTGSCLKVLVASSRGEPVPFCVAGNRLVTKLSRAGRGEASWRPAAPSQGAEGQALSSALWGQRQDLRERHGAGAGDDQAECKRMLRHWNRLPRAVGIAPSLVEFKKRLDTALRCRGWFLGGSAWSHELNSMVLVGPLQLRLFYD